MIDPRGRPAGVCSTPHTHIFFLSFFFRARRRSLPARERAFVCCGVRTQHQGYAKAAMATTAMATNAAAAEASCVHFDGRIDAAPSWCKEFDESSCAKRFVLNLHRVPHPCMWTEEVGCYNADSEFCAGELPTSLITTSLPSLESELADRSDSSAFSWLVSLTVLAALAFGVFRWHEDMLTKLGLLEFYVDVRARLMTKLRKDNVKTDELERLQDDEEAPVTETLQSLNASSRTVNAKEVESAIAAAHVLLEENTNKVVPDAPVVSAAETPVESEAVDANQADPSIGSSGLAQDEEDSVEDGGAPEGETPEEPDLPPLQVLGSMAAFEEGDLLDKIASANAIPSTSDAQESDHGEDIDGENPQASLPVKISQRELAMSLD